MYRYFDKIYISVTLFMILSRSALLATIKHSPCLKVMVIKLEYSLRLKIKGNDWLLADTCPQAANHCALF